MDEQTTAAYGIIDPDYARIFTIGRCIAWSQGYALLMNGSFTRDLDLLAVPWTDRATDPEHLVRRIVGVLDELDLLVKDPDAPSQASEKPHGRLAWTLTFKAFGDPRFVDLSVMPRLSPSPAEAEALPAGVDAYDRGRRDMLNSILALNPAVAATVFARGANALAVKALALLPREAPAAVAWQVRPLGDKVWHFTDDPRPTMGYEKRPLFASPAPAPEDPARFRHKKRGTLYEVIGQAQIQTSRPLEDYEVVTVYRSLNTGDMDDPSAPMKGDLWVRPKAEFEDGRFEALATQADAPKGDA